VACLRQFLDRYEPPKGYNNDEVKRECSKMYVTCLGFRVSGHCGYHTTVITGFSKWRNLPDAYDPETVLKLKELSDEL